MHEPGLRVWHEEVRELADVKIFRGNFLFVLLAKNDRKTEKGSDLQMFLLHAFLLCFPVRGLEF